MSAMGRERTVGEEWKADVRRVGLVRVRVLRKVSRIAQLGLKSCHNPLERLGFR